MGCSQLAMMKFNDQSPSCHPERSEGSVYELLTSYPYLCTNIVARVSKGHALEEREHRSLAGLRWTETGGVTRLVTHTRNGE